MVVAVVLVVVVCGEYGRMVDTKAYTKEEYVTLITTISSAVRSRYYIRGRLVLHLTDYDEQGFASEFIQELSPAHPM